MRSLRTSAKWLTLAAVFLCVLAVFPVGALARTYSAQEVAFVQLINDYRQQRGLSRLLVSDLLSDAARKHSSDMGKYSFFSHTTVASDYFPVNSTPWVRMAACGYGFNTYKGENIAAGYSTANGVFAAWRASAGHNQIMLTAQYAVIGIAQVYVPGSVYGYYWTADFGGYVDDSAHALGTTSTTQSVTTTTKKVTTTTQSVTTTQRLTTTTRPSTPTTRLVTTTTRRH